MNAFRITALTLVLCLFATIGRAQNDAISTYFNQYLEDEQSTVVYISGRMFDLMESVVSNIQTDDMTPEQMEALTEVVSDMRALRIVNRPGNGVAQYKAAKAKLLKAQPYEILMTVRDKGKTFVDFYVRETKDGVVDELLLLVAESPEGVATKALADEDLDEVGLEELKEGSFTMLSFEGRIAIDRIGQLAKSFED